MLVVSVCWKFSFDVPAEASSAIDDSAKHTVSVTQISPLILNFLILVALLYESWTAFSHEQHVCVSVPVNELSGMAVMTESVVEPRCVVDELRKWTPG